MSPENFCYWLQGFIEIENPMNIGENQTKIIKDHLQLVFKKETPNYTIFKDSNRDGVTLPDIFCSFNSNTSC
jgi:hypothetical protein